VFEAAHTAKVGAPASAVWPLWGNPARWPEWNPQIQGAQVDGELRVGTTVRVKMRRGGIVRHEVVELDPGARLVTETRFPGARTTHEHRVADVHQGAEITHVIRVSGPLWAPWSVMLGRRRMRESVREFVDSERNIVGSRGARSRKRGGG
jgi:uncharacterized protein YndB with AHSA1/START domain